MWDGSIERGSFAETVGELNADETLYGVRENWSGTFYEAGDPILDIKPNTSLSDENRYRKSASLRLCYGEWPEAPNRLLGWVPSVSRREFYSRKVEDREAENAEIIASEYTDDRLFETLEDGVLGI